MMPLPFLLVSFLGLFFPILTLAQEASVSKQCLFSCPLTNINPTNPWPLVKSTHAIGWDSHYTIFECVYAVPSSHSDLAIREWKCAYDKRTGHQVLAAAYDNCPPMALPCPTSDSSSSGTTHTQQPQFSAPEKVKVLPWVENGRFLLYLMEHHPA